VSIRDVLFLSIDGSSSGSTPRKPFSDFVIQLHHLTLLQLRTLVTADLLLDFLDAALQAQDLLLQGGLLSLQRGDLLLQSRVVRPLLREVALDLVLHALNVGDHRLLQLLELRLVVLLNVLLVVSCVELINSLYAFRRGRSLINTHK